MLDTIAYPQSDARSLAPPLDRDELFAMADRVIDGGAISPEEARRVVGYPRDLLPDLFSAVNRIRLARRGRALHLCSIINAKAGGCAEKCDFCAQSAHFDTASPRYQLVSVDAIVEGAHKARTDGAAEYGIVTVGRALDRAEEFAQVLDAVSAVRDHAGIEPHASLGALTLGQLQALKAAGLVEYHHNLETCRRLHPEIVHSHDYDEEVETVLKAKAAGLRVCCGGIIGMGESWEDRLDFAFELAAIAPDTIPLNVLIPVEGTAIAARARTVPPLDILVMVALLRFTNPASHLLFAAGRDLYLRDLQSMIFHAGASGMMIGDYLTTRNRGVAQDHQMLADLELSHGGR